MSIHFSAVDVLLHLNELGFSNISAQQLKDFMKDLKKLIKYEERQAESDFADNIDRNKNSSTPNQIGQDIFENLYHQQTEASKAKVVPKSRKIIEVEIRRRRVTNIDHPHCVHVNKVPIALENEEELMDEKPSDIDEQDAGKKATCFRRKQSAKKSLDQQKGTKSDDTATDGKRTTRGSSAKSTTPPAFIRPCISKTNKKTDPVALYHKYQNEWKKMKIPGEVDRSRLRWQVRNRMAFPR